MAEGRLKRCPHCRELKPLDGFGRRKRSPSGRKSWCRACESSRQQQRYRERRLANVCIDCGRMTVSASHVLCVGCRARRAQALAARRASGKCITCGHAAQSGRSRCAACIARERFHHLSCRRGVSQSEYTSMLARQAERCAICRRSCGTGRRLAVDHDHCTGRVRGLLCFQCNTSLARYEEYAQQFAQYLSRVVRS